MAKPLNPSAPYVFLSYASADRDRALRIADVLEGQGIPVWIDRHSIEGGASWSARIVEGIRRCAALVVLCTPAAMGSRNVRQEIQLAWDADRPAIPFLLEPAEYPPRSPMPSRGASGSRSKDTRKSVGCPALCARCRAWV